MKIIFLGAPGAGKGTQAELVAERLGIPTISTGAIIRSAVKDCTKMGLEAKKFIDEYSVWGDLHKYIANVIQKLGVKPYRNIRTFL